MDPTRTDSPRVDQSTPDAAAGSATADVNRDADHQINTRARSTRLTRLTLVIILAGAAAVYLAALTPERFGSFHDDGIYVVTAKAMATGQGYRIISLPYEPAQTKYPPLYPFMLSLIWKANPDFPHNLTMMMWLSIASTLGFLAIAFRYLITQG